MREVTNVKVGSTKRGAKVVFAALALSFGLLAGIASARSPAGFDFTAMDSGGNAGEGTGPQLAR